MNVRKSLAIASATVALGGGLALAAPAAQATPAAHGGTAATAAMQCKQHKITVPSDRGAVAYWECHRTYHGHKQASTQIWVYDKKADGKCVYGTVKIGGWRHTYKACPKGHNVSGARSGWHNGADAQVIMSIR
ncbi:hypothetical protein ABZ484_29255 [Streptomyces sp. NPDC006393]|uniref:hypothetical protein n=1 Tax=Streptomyces sp. NPDC006393 TaxID=3156763 RepID=UPI0033E96615